MSESMFPRFSSEIGLKYFLELRPTRVLLWLARSRSVHGLFVPFLVLLKISKTRTLVTVLDIVPPMANDFPCTHYGCPRTFRRLNSRTQHCNANHRPLSPDSEPDPVHQFRVKYHPKLNGIFSQISIYCSNLPITPIALP